jgi:hypothetical protein
LGGQLVGSPEPPKAESFASIFEKVFPFYISIGMSPEQFWDGDVSLVKAYRKAYEYKKQEWNVQAYLNGMYVYDALLRVSPILHAFAKKGAKPIPYRDQPIEIYSNHQQQQKAKVDKSREMQLKMVEKFKKINQRLSKKE